MWGDYFSKAYAIKELKISEKDIKSTSDRWALGGSHYNYVDIIINLKNGKRIEEQLQIEDVFDFIGKQILSK